MNAAVETAQQDQTSLTAQLAQLQSANQEKLTQVEETQAKIDYLGTLPETILEVRKQYGANSARYQAENLWLGSEGYVFLPLFTDSHMFDQPLPII